MKSTNCNYRVKDKQGNIRAYFKYLQDAEFYRDYVAFGPIHRYFNSSKEWVFIS